MLHIIQNDPEVPPGNLLDHLAVPYSIINIHLGEKLPKLESITALILLGGSMGANDDQRHPFLTTLKQLIRDVVAAGIPYLGICLGGQLLAAALGAQVVSNRWEELGTLPVALTENAVSDRLFAGIKPEFTTFQWHHDSFDLPQGSVLLAASDACPHQAFRVGASAWGIQFHPEVTEAIIRGWSAWDETTAQNVETLVARFLQNHPAHIMTAQRLWHNFMQIAGLLTQPHQF